MTWRETTAIVWLGFSLGALTDTALRSRMSSSVQAPHALATSSGTEKAPAESAASRTDKSPVASGSSRTDNAPVVSGFSRTDKTNSPAGSGFSRTDGDAVATTGVARESAVDILRQRRLDVPVEGVQRKDLHDTFSETRSGSRAHEALDIMAGRRTPVHAAEDGVVQKLFTSKAGGLTVYQFDPTGTFCYYYAHLDAYAAGVHEGQRLRKGDVIGYVGSTGNAAPDAPHLHFAIFRLTPERQWWKGEPINPYDVLK